MKELFDKLYSVDTSVILCIIIAVIVIELIVFLLCKLCVKKSRTRTLKIVLDKTTYVRVKQLADNRGLTPQEFTKKFLENFANDEK